MASDEKYSDELAKLKTLLAQKEREIQELRTRHEAHIARLTSELQEAKRGWEANQKQPSLLHQLAQAEVEKKVRLQEDDPQEEKRETLGAGEEQHPLLLKACELRELIEAKQQDYFQGSREWLFEAVREWLREDSNCENNNSNNNDNNNENKHEEKKDNRERDEKEEETKEDQSKNTKRLFWLVGGAGTGKSVVSAQLLATVGVREHVKAWHFCRHDNAAGSDMRVILESWAAMLSALLPSSFHVAENVTKETLAASSVEKMFDLLIAEPFRRMQQQQEHSHVSPCLLVLDAVDELPRDCLEPVLQLIADKFDELPSFVKLFVASRDVPEISKRLSRFKHVKLLVDDVRNQADLRVYLAHVARRHVTLELSTEDLETQLEREFKLLPFRLRGELRGLDQLLRRSKDTYAAAIAKLEQDNGKDGEAYRELCGISDIHSQGVVRQYTDNLEQLYEDAREAHHKLRSLFAKEWRVWKPVDGGKTVLSVPVEGTTALWVDRVVDPDLKSRESALRKIATDYKNEASRMKDLVRFTASFASCGRMKRFVEQLRTQAGLKVVALKNKYASPTPLGYRDVNVTLQVELESGRFHVCELQVNLEDMLVAKDTAHDFYEEVRVQIPALCERVKISEAPKFESSLTKMLRSSVLETAVQELQAKAGGLFLYASLLAHQLEGSVGGKIDFKQLRGLPVGLSEVYQTNFERMVQSREDWNTHYSRLIALIVAAREPLPVTVARETMRDGNEALERALSLLFPVREGRIQVMHKSIVDWLQDSEHNKGEYKISQEDIQTAHECLGKSLHTCLLPPVLAGSSPHVTDAVRLFCVHHVVYHLCTSGLWEELFEVVTDVKWLLDRAEMEPLGVVLDLEYAAANSLFAEASPQHHSTVKLMGQALRMDLGELQFDYRSVPTRLVARLVGHASSMPEVQGVLARLREWEGPPQGWWCPAEAYALDRIRWDFPFGPLESTFQLPSAVRSVQWNSVGDLIAVASGNDICIWNLSERKCRQTLRGHSAEVTNVSWSVDGTRIHSISQDGTVRVWAVSNGACVQTLKRHSANSAVSWSSDGSRICSSEDNTVQVWEVSSGKCIRTLAGHSKRVPVLSWSRDGSRICSSDDDTVRVWEVSTGQCIQTLEGRCFDGSWNRDGSRIIICSGGWDDVVRVWEVSSGECIHTLKGNSNRVTVLSWSSDEKRICTGSHDKTVRVWEVSSGNLIQILGGHSSSVTAVSWSLDDKIICSGGSDHMVRVWEVSTGDSARYDDKPTFRVAWSRDGSQVCVGNSNWQLRVWDMSSGKCIHNIDEHFDRDNSVSWSRDGRICFGGRCLRVGEHHERTNGWVVVVSWSSDGNRICTADRNMVLVWEACEFIKVLDGHLSPVIAVAWSSDDSKICSGSYRDKTVRVWEVESGECIRIIEEGVTENVTVLSWNNDGSRICGCSDDYTVRVWDVDSGGCIQTLEGHSDVVNALSWSNDDSKICSGSLDATVRVWDVSSAHCLLIASSMLPGPLVSPFCQTVVLPVGVRRDDRRLWLCPFRPDVALEIKGVSKVLCLRRLGGTPGRSWFDLASSGNAEQSILATKTFLFFPLGSPQYVEVVD